MITHFAFGTLLLIALAVAGGNSQEKSPPSDLNRVKDGAAAPDFTLEDQEGNRVTLSSFHGKKKVVLVFYRGYW